MYDVQQQQFVMKVIQDNNLDNRTAEKYHLYSSVESVSQSQSNPYLKNKFKQAVFNTIEKI